MFEDKMLPRDKFKVEDYQTLHVDQCAEFCRRQNCRSFELVGSETCILSNVSAWMTGKNGYDSLVPAPGSRYYERSKHHLGLFTRLPGYVYRNDSRYSNLIHLSGAEECAEACVTTSGFSCNSFAYSQGNSVCALSADVIRSPNDLKKVKNYDTFEYAGDWACNVTLPWGFNPRVISTSKYPFYPKLNKTCTFNLVAPPNKSIVLTILSLFINRSVCSEGTSGVFIYDGDSDQSTLLLSICRNSPELVMSSMKSSGNVFIKIVTSDKPVVMKISYDYAAHDACDGHECRNGGSCLPNNQSYSCACSKEFSGTFCETDIINGCDSNPCTFGKCFDKFQGYECQCYKGVTGKRCETYLGRCSSKPCKYGVCIPILSDYRCECAVGYTGRNCEYEINECFSSPCGIHGHCIDKVDNYSCVCDNGYTGRNCHISKLHNSCTDYQCKYGTCAVNESGSFCQCFPGFTGSSCKININECSISPCGSHGRCVDHVNGYSCQCSMDWYGAHCNISKSSSCRNSNCVHGYCSVISPDGDFKCVCETNYTGSRCSEVIAPCSPSPCAFGECTEIGSYFECNCTLGHTGRYCDDKVSYCENNSCVHGKCVEGTGSYKCLCDRGWIGGFCDVKSNNCTNVNCYFGKCVETFDGVDFECMCHSNHTGKFCEYMSKVTTEGMKSTEISTPLMYVRSTTGPDIVDMTLSSSVLLHPVTEVDPCSKLACRNGKCISDRAIGSRACLCNKNYTGKLCDAPIRENIVHNPFDNTVHVNNNKSGVCKNKTCINGKCIQYFDKAICLCGKNDTRNDCELKRDSVNFAANTIATVTKPSDIDFTNEKQQSHSTVTANKFYIGNGITSKIADITNESIQKPTSIATNVIDRLNTTASSGNKQPYLKVAQANKIDGIGVANRNKHHPAKVVNNNEHNLPTVTELIKLMHTEVTDEPFTINSCSRDECVHGECKLEINIYRCHCHDGFKGKVCNISIISVNESNLHDKSDSGSPLEYVAIAAVCLCLLLFMFVGGFLWYKRAKRQRGSLYIRNPIDFEVKDTISDTTEEEDLSEQSADTVRKNDSKQSKPITRCAWYLSSGTSDCSGESRQENICDDVNVHIQEQADPVNNNEFGLPQQQIVNGFNENATEHLNRLTDLKTGNKSSTLPPYRPLLIRPPDKRYIRFPGFQTINGVQKDKSEV